jgi:hypothetical protein
VRWKHVSEWYAVSGSVMLTDDASTVCEFWGGFIPFGSPAAASNMVVVRQDIHVGLLNDVHGAMGVSPGYGGQGFGGPPTNCEYLDIWTTWGGFYYLTTPYDSAFLNFLPTGSGQVAHMATSFRPGIPGEYLIEAF